jgi:Glycosyl hydrolase family 20, domain 2/Glycosyl hydrolase family 20, catalytic domain
MAKRSKPLLLLPQPRTVRRSASTFTFAGRVPISLPPEADGPDLVAARQLAADLDRLGVESSVARRAGGRDAVPGGVAVRRGRVKGGDEAYRLTIRAGGIELVAPTAAGAYYGLQTVRQLVRQFGKRVPGLSIEDWPDFKMRGVYHDISRGRVPTVATLKQLIERLAHLKVNTLSLYIKYPFRYERHPTIWEDTDPLTADDILELKTFAADHAMDLQPSQASFGHLELVLSKPAYRHLANTPAARTSKETRTFNRSGTSLDPTNPASIKLMADLFDELLPQFDSPYFNACCDEVWDLGEGKSAARAKQIGKGPLFAEFITKIHGLSARHGKRLMIWADILKHYPDSIDRIPDDVILLNWWYYDQKIEEWMVDHSRAIKRSGHELVVCPGVNNWGAFMPRTHQMRENIRLFAKAGLEAKALGLLNTEWGDGGHFNLLATALPGFATGAEHSWCHGTAEEKTIGRRWPLHMLEDRTSDAERIITLADYGKGGHRQTFTGFGNERKLDFEAIKSTPEKVLTRQLKFNEQLMTAMDTAIGLSKRFYANDWVGADAAWGFQAAMEYAVLSAFTLAKGSAVCGQMNRLLGNGTRAREQFKMAAEMTGDLLPDYRGLWMARNRKSELDWSIGRFRQAMARWRRAAKAK